MIKKCYYDYYRKQEQVMSADKVKGRVIGFDLNPGCIGICVMDLKEGKTTIVKQILLDWRILLKKIRLKSDDEMQLKHNMRLKNAIFTVFHHISIITKHYRPEKVIIENLDDVGGSLDTHEANRRSRNLWHRAITMRWFKKFCAENGILLEKIHACYTSFIGNIQYPDIADPCAAATEIARRGITRDIKGSFYPTICDKDCDTLRRLFVIDDEHCLDVAHIMTDNWVNIHKSARKLFTTRAEFERRWRTSAENATRRCQQSRNTYHKSGVTVTYYSNL